ncbi:DUF6984 family protein [Achromobacter xylosoxidans]|uniref:DUF6984 family protein n=1 Tax=Alcaligenes xylosoxydans xylosoxydans TaxID=85698 RepID=UPI0011B066C7|nr:hypothetical protein [Achromobacter xylosoxidans]
MTRQLLQEEWNVIRAVAEKLPIDRKNRLLADLELATAYSFLPDNSIIKFNIAGYNRPPRGGQDSFGVEGELLDRDGTRVGLILFADKNDRLLELELIRWGDGDLIGPKWETLKLYHCGHIE